MNEDLTSEINAELEAIADLKRCKIENLALYNQLAFLGGQVESLCDEVADLRAFRLLATHLAKQNGHKTVSDALPKVNE